MRHDMSDSEVSAWDQVRQLEAEVKDLRDAVRVLAHDKVNGVPDMIGADVVSNTLPMTR